MKFASSISRRFEAKDATQRSAFSGGQSNYRLTNKFDWSVDKAVSQGMEKVTWVFKAVHTIASNQAKLPIVMREDDRWDGPVREDHELLALYNRKANPYEKSVGWRYRLSCLLLLSRDGVFVEVLRNRMGEVLGLYILPPGYTHPIKDPDTFVSGFEVVVPSQPRRVIEPEDVLWFRSQHPTDPYRSLIPLEACGLAVESDWWAKLYNRNFMANDGRPAGIVVLKGGDMEDDDVKEIEARLHSRPGTSTKRISLVSSEQGADWLDLNTSPKDAEWLSSISAGKQEIAVAFGTPLTVMGDTSDRTYENADADKETFWGETMPFHLETVGQGFDDLDGDESLFAGFDVSGVEYLQKVRQAKEKHLLELLRDHAITVDEFREATGRDLLGGSAARLWRPINLVTVDDEVPAPVRLVAASRHLGLVLPGRVLEPAAPLELPPVTPALKVSPEMSQEDTAVDFGAWKVSARRLNARRKERESKLVAWEKTARISMEKFLARQGRVVLEKLEGKKVREMWTEEKDGQLVLSKAKVPSPSAIFDRSTWNAQLKDDAQAWVEGVVEDFGSDVVDTFEAKAAEVGFDMVDPEVVALIENRVNRVVGVNDTTYENIKSAMAAGVEEGETIAELAKRIRAVFATSKTRAERIARTEVVGAANGGAMLGAKATGMDLEKVWLSTSDSRTRASHSAAGGQTVAMDEKFLVGGYEMEYPGDPAAPIGELANCRCTCIFAEVDGDLVL